MRTLVACLVSAGLGAGASLAFAASHPRTDSEQRSAEAILSSYVADFRADPAASEARTFGVRVDGDGGGEWTVVIRGARSVDEDWEVDLRAGAPKEPTFVYTVDSLATLQAVDEGHMNALTAQGKAFPGDVAPVDVEFMPGADPHDVNAFSFHFWTRGFPERVPFDRALSRVVHGANNVVFYYQPGLRSVWSSIARGQRVDNGPGQPMVIPFPMMAFVIAGRAHGKLAGQHVLAQKGEMVFIPAMTPYEWWNEDEEDAEVILIMFGEGA